MLTDKELMEIRKQGKRPAQPVLLSLVPRLYNIPSEYLAVRYQNNFNWLALLGLDCILVADSDQPKPMIDNSIAHVLDVGKATREALIAEAQKLGALPGDEDRQDMDWLDNADKLIERIKSISNVCDLLFDLRSVGLFFADKGEGAWLRVEGHDLLYPVTEPLELPVRSWRLAA